MRKRWQAVFAAVGTSLLVLQGCSSQSPEGTEVATSDEVATSGSGLTHGSSIDPSDCTGFSHRITQGNGLAGTTGQELGSRPSLEVTCLTATLPPAPLEDFEVVWTVTSGGGSVDGQTTATTRTNPAGIASVAWVLGSVVGQQTIEAEYAGVNGRLRQAFVATAGAPPRCDAAVGGTDHGFVRMITTDETWTAATSPHRGGTIQVSDGALLTIMPGATVCVDHLQFTKEARLTARGTAAQPIVFSGASTTSLWGGLIFDPPAANVAPAAPSILEYALVENARAVTITHPTVVSDVTFRRTLANAPGFAQVYVTMSDPAPRFVRVVVDGFGSASDPQSGLSNPAVNLLVVPLDPFAPPTTFDLSVKVVNSPGDGLVLGAGGNSVVKLTSCEFSGNGGNGLVARGDTRHLTVTGCNFVNNGLAGVRYDENVYSALAIGNWWGDPAGAAAGDGVFGNVDASSPLPQPVVLGY